MKFQIPLGMFMQFRRFREQISHNILLNMTVFLKLQK